MKFIKTFYSTGFLTILSIIVIFLITSCGQSPQSLSPGDIFSIKPDLQKVENPESWSFAIKDIDFVILESSKQSIIKQINKMVVDDNFYYILDKNLLHIFDKQGDFITSLPQKGKGPGEATKIHDFCIDRKNNLFILAERGKMLVYQSLNFSKECQTELQGVPISPVNFQIEEDNTYYWMDRFGYSYPSKSPKKLMFASESNKEQVISLFSQKYFTSKMSRFNQANEEYLITPPIGSDTIFNISKDGIYPYMAIDFGKFSSSKKGVNISGEMDDPFTLLSDLKKQNLVGELMYAVKNDNYTSVLFPNPINETYCNLIVENKSGTSHVFSVMPFENLFYPGMLYSAYNNKFISSKESYLIKDCIKKNKIVCDFLSEQRRRELLNKLKDVKETDNPVLMIITTKSQSNEER